MPAPIEINGLFHTTVLDGGRVVIPAPIRHSLNLESGTQVAIRLVDDRIELIPQNQLISELQAIARRHPGKRGKLASEELIQERRQAAKRGD